MLHTLYFPRGFMNYKQNGGLFILRLPPTDIRFINHEPMTALEIQENCEMKDLLLNVMHEKYWV